MSPTFFADLAGYIALGESAVGIVTSMIKAVQDIKERGRAPTQEELHAIALDARAAFEALPKPE
jgi:hypothetical protein